MNATATAPEFAGHTAAEWLEKAADAERRRQESWERSDTDGFLSQHALEVMARRYRDCATVAELGGYRLTLGFQDVATGEVLVGAYRPTSYGSGYAVEGRREWLFPSMARRAATALRNDERKGYRRAWIVAPQELEGRTGHAIDDVNRPAEWRLATAAEVEAANVGSPYVDEQ